MKSISTATLLVSVTLIGVGGACNPIGRGIQERASGAMYFHSPEEAVPVIAELLRQEEFKTLAQHYDLSRSDIPRSDLESGDFFIRKRRPEAAHPAGFWRYKHPFPPGFKYSGMRPSTVGEGIHLVTVTISIDQGAASPSQEGRFLFFMIESERGWQLLPDGVEDGGTT